MSTDINVIINDACWAWPQAMAKLFSPRGIQLLLVKNAEQALITLQQRRVHTAIMDLDSESGMTIVKMIRSEFPLLPCILITASAEEKLLSAALELNAFSVINKPVDISLLENQLHRLFLKKYGINLFV